MGIRIGDIFGQLRVIEYLGVTGSKKRPYKTYQCQCSCGNLVKVKGYLLTSGRVTSCGCKRKKVLLDNSEAAKKAGTNVGYLKNRKVRSNNRTGAAGVSRYKNGKWVARITFKGHNHYLGSYETKEEAIEARKASEKELYDNYLEDLYEE